MRSFREFNQLFTENAGITVSGEGIEWLRAVFEDMYHRGAPNIKNDYGFNGQHYPVAKEIIYGDVFNSTELPVPLVNKMLYILATYQNTQVTNYKQIVNAVKQDLAKHQKFAETDDKTIFVYNTKMDNWGNIRVYIPNGIDKSARMGINKILNAKEIPTDQRWKYVRNDKNNLHSYFVNKSVIEDIMEYFKTKKGFAVKFEDPGKTYEEPKPEDIKELEIIGLQDTQWGKKIVIHIEPFKKRTGAYQAIKAAGLAGKGMAFNDQWDFLISTKKPLYDKVHKILEDQGIDLTDLDDFVTDNNIFAAYAKPDDPKPEVTAKGFSPEDFENWFNRLIQVYQRIFPGPPTEEDLQGLKNSIEELGKVEIILANHPDPKKRQQAKKMIYDLKDFLEKQGLAASFAAKGQYQKHQNINLQFTDIPGSDKIKVKIPYYDLTKDESEFLKQHIIYILPNYSYDWNDYAYTTSGNYKQYFLLGQLLAKHGFPVDKLRKIVEDKIARGDIEVAQYEGKLDPDFKGKIEQKLPESKFDLYDAQKDGIGFLYSRDHAVLGDETGLGKTVQLVSAAALKMQKTNRPTLIITLKSTQEQWKNEIVSVMGEQEASEISTDPRDPKKWTVLYYENFSSPKNVPQYSMKRHEQQGKTYICADTEEDIKKFYTGIKNSGFDASEPVKTHLDKKPWCMVSTKKAYNAVLIKSMMQKLLNANFGICIFDELHKIKRESALRTQNLTELLKDVPTRWGATATISANKPLDVQNQLKMIGHPLGSVKPGKFKKDFCGMEAKGYGGAYVEGTQENQIRAAENLNKWLNLSGLYVRRSKQDIKDMPNLDVKTDETDLDLVGFGKKFKEKVKKYKNPDLAVSQLIAARDIIASQKTDETTQRVAEIVSKNQDDPNNNFAASKIVVFTNFIEAGQLLTEKITQALKSINPEYYPLTYLSATKKAERQKVKKIFTDDKNAKVLVMSMKMGGTGIDFPNAAQNMIINDFDWTPEAAEQSEGRIYRINTTHPVNITYIVGNGQDAELFERVKRKRDLAVKIQKWRNEFQQLGDDPKADEKLEDIVQAQKENAKANEEMAAIVADLIEKVKTDPKIEITPQWEKKATKAAQDFDKYKQGYKKAESLSFKDFVGDVEEVKRVLFG
jgi:superfamily II DNA or RNA helicase